MKNISDETISILHMRLKGRTSSFQISQGNSKMEKQRKQRLKKTRRIPENCGRTTKSVTYMYWEFQKKERKEKRRNIKQYWLKTSPN